MQRTTWLLGALLLAACGAPSSSQTTASDRDAPAGVAPDAYRSLIDRTGGSWTIETHEAFHTVSHLEGRADGTLTWGDSGYSAAVRFIEANKTLFSMRDPASELRLTRERTDERGMRHVRMQQVVRGLRVVDAEVMAHFDKSGALLTVDARYVPALDKLDLNPVLDEKAALAIAVKDAAMGRANATTSPTAPELVVFADGVRDPKLTFTTRVRVEAPHSRPEIWVYQIDAKTGAVVNKYDDVQTIEGSGTGVKGDTKKIQVSQQGASYSLVDTTRTPNNITTYDAANSQQTPGSLVTSQSLTSWDTEAQGAPGSAVDAHYHAGVVYDFYKKTMNRAGIDGQDGAIVSTVHFDQQYDNAFWDGQQMVYGDGDNQEFYGLAAGLDVVGHELTHGVTQNESNLTYQGQSGALNESMSDIMGSFVEHYSTPDPVKNWECGEVIGVQGPIRDLAHPANGQQPSHLSQYVNTSQDNGGVHVNSGIPNNAAYLMTVGGTNDKSQTKVAYGIGWDKAQQLWYLTNTTYLTSGSNFKAAAAANASAAKALNFTQNEQNIVACAWIAVGVSTGSCQTLTDPAPPSSGSNGTTTNGTSSNGSSNSSDGTSSGSRGGTSSSGASGGSTGSSGSGSSSSGSSGSSSNDGEESSDQTVAGYGQGRFAQTSSGGCSVSQTSAPDAGGFAAFGIGFAGMMIARRRAKKNVVSA